MYTGKYHNKKRFHKRNLALLVSILLIVTVVTSGTIAWLTAGTDNIVNKFSPSFVPNEVEETFEDNVKSNVSIKNTSENVTAYIRAAVIFNWVMLDESGESYVVSGTPVVNGDYEIEWFDSSSAWVYSNGYYYHTTPVEAGQNTDYLIKACKPVAGKGPAGYSLSVEILGESIQANPEQVVVDAWGVNPSTLKAGG